MVINAMGETTPLTPSKQGMNVTPETLLVSSGSYFEEERENLYGIYVYPFVFLIFYMIIGLIGNSIVIYIFTWEWKSTKTTIFILTLAGVDIVSCLFNMPIEAAILWKPLDFDHDILCKVSRFTTFICSVSSAFVLVSISIDRYLMVCRPFYGRELGVRYAKRTCLIAVLLGILTTWPSLIIYGTFTYQIDHVPDINGVTLQIEGKTCMLSNYYVDNYRLPSGFYFFLFGGHVIMFLILIMLYTLIGRSLFMSANTGVSNERRHSLRYFGISMMSALTGSIPNNISDNRDAKSNGSRNSRTLSYENINRIDHSPSTLQPISNGILPLTRPRPKRTFSEPGLSSITIAQEIRQSKVHNHANLELHSLDDKASMSSDDHLIAKQDGDNKLGSDNQVHIDMNKTVGDHNDNHPVHYTKQNTPVNKKRHLLTLPTNDLVRNNTNGDDLVRRYDRLSSGSTISERCQTPVTPDSVKGILLRSQSIESRARLNRIISDELRHSGMKEESLRQNTLVLRMVTIAFIISFLPYLIIVIIRYSNPDIPIKLNRTEQIVYHVFLRTYFINSMINPFIYGFMNEEFRAKLKSLFCKVCTIDKPKA